MTSHTAHTETLVAPTLINIAARGRPGSATSHDATRAEAVVLNDTVAPPLWRGAASRAEVATAVATQAIAAGGQVHSAQRAEVLNISDLTDVTTSANQPPSWGSSSGTVFNLKQGETLNLVNALRFTDPDGDALIVTQIAGTLPTDVTYDPATGLITAQLTATIGLHAEDLIFQADDAQQTVRNVGPGKQYSTIRAAVLAAQDGDTIQIDPGDYIGDVSTLTANNILIKGTSTTNRARLFANGVHQSDKGIIVLEGDNCTFENMEFHDAEGPSQNIAGVRHDGAGLTTFRRCGFYDCENGILSGGGGTVLMEFCEFARNGFGDGQTHNVYFGTHSLVTARDCYFHEAKIGHEFKSRAKENILERCYFVNGPTGTASYEVNVDNGGKLVMRGCMLHKGPNADNQNMIFHNVNSWGSSFNSITLEHCTLVHAEPTGSFINLASGSTAVTLTTCLFASNGRPLVTGATPVQNSNFHTTVATLLGASNIADPDFWPDASIHPDLSLPSAVVPTYLIDEPNIFTPRTLASPPRVIGAIQNALVTGSADFWAMPSLQDEQDLYDTLGWTYVLPADQTFSGYTTTAPASLSFDIHNETEADDLWIWYNHVRRGYSGTHFEASQTASWLACWLNYYKSGKYRTEQQASDLPSNSGTYCHIYGYGLTLYAHLENDLVAMDEARAIGDLAIKSYSIGDDSVTKPPIDSMIFAHGAGGRREARFMLSFCYLAQATGESKWIEWRDHIIDHWINTDFGWEEAPATEIVQGGHYFVPRGWLPYAANGTAADWDAGRRVMHVVQNGILNEAFWFAYLATGRADVRDRLVKMARYVQYYAHDPSDTVFWTGANIGQPSGGPFISSYFGSQPVAIGGPYYHRHVNNPGPGLSYAYADAQMVNTLVRGYKLTGDITLLDKAKECFRIGTRWAQLQPGSSGQGPLVPANEVARFIDTKSDNTGQVFDQDKGQLFYTYMLMENGGNPSIIP